MALVSFTTSSDNVYDMPNAKQLADGRWECQNCLGKFTRYKRSSEHRDGWTKEPKFCDDACRKEFHFTGGMGYRRMKDIVRRIVFEMDKERGITA